MVLGFQQQSHSDKLFSSQFLADFPRKLLQSWHKVISCKIPFFFVDGIEVS
jgi:hypothetical protein